METLLTVLKSGAVINFFLVVAGGFLGTLLRKGIPARVRDTLMSGMAFCVMYIGISGLFEDDINPLIIVISTGLGAVLGELINIDRLVNCLGQNIEKRLSRGKSDIAQGFVSATLLFCIGAMTVVGAIDSGISGDNTTLYSKSVIDCISGAVLASAMGAGVLLAAIPVLIIEGGLTLLAAFVQPILTSRIIAHMSVIGSMLIIAISFNMLELGKTKIKVMNLLPAVFLPILFCRFM